MVELQVRNTYLRYNDNKQTKIWSIRISQASIGSTSVKAFGQLLQSTFIRIRRIYLYLMFT